MQSIKLANEEIERAVLQEWEASSRPLLISKLGSRLSPDAKSEIAETGYGLKRFVQEYMSASVRLVPLKSRGGGVAPVQQTQGYSDAELEENYEKDKLHPDADVVDVPMYWGDVWRGFQRELPNDTVRYILVNPFGRPAVVDAPEGADLPETAKIVERNDLLLAETEGGRPPRTAVHHAIENWCLRNGLPQNALLFNPSSASRRADVAVDARRRSNSPHSSRPDRLTSLMHGLDLLSRDELARINIPADLLLAILERSGSR